MASIPRSMSVDTFSVPTTIEWLVGTDRSFAFLGVDVNGNAHRFDGHDPTQSILLTNSNGLNPDTPLMAELDSNATLVPLPQPVSVSTLSTAVPLPDGGRLFVNKQQRVTQLRPDGTDVTVADVSAIPDPLLDGQITYSHANGLWALYAKSTRDRYIHGILGDFFEGYALYVLRWHNETGLVGVEASTTLEGGSLVFEGLAPLWADVNGDGIDDILTTVAQDRDGAGLRLYFVTKEGTSNGTIAGVPTYRLDGLPFASSGFIGTSDRWLHQLAVGPLGPNGETEIVEIRTPHIGGIVRYYRWNSGSNELDLVARANSDYTSHDIGSRNLDQAVVADLNGDGILELVVQNQGESAVFGLQRCTTDGVGVAWKVDMPGRLQSNVALSCTDQGKDNATIGLLMSTNNQRIIQLTFRPDVNSTIIGCTSNAFAGTTRIPVLDGMVGAVATVMSMLLITWVR